MGNPYLDRDALLTQLQETGACEVAYRYQGAHDRDTSGAIARTRGYARHLAAELGLHVTTTAGYDRLYVTEAK